jgi:hypothetical protein
MSDDLNRLMEEAMDDPLGNYERGPDDGPEDYEEPDFDDGSNSWTTYRLWTVLNFKVYVEWATNDDDDDGQDDGEVATASYGPFNNLHEALEFTNGGTRTGCIGTDVKVYLDHQLIYTTWTEAKGRNEYGHPRYLPFCEYTGPQRRATD